jgi:hypothetical protein
MAFSSEVLAAIDQAAAANGLDAAALRAVVEVESGGTALSRVDGRDVPLILYEPHVFYRWPGLTSDERDRAVARRLAARRWGDIPYPAGQAARYGQLARAAEINEQAAYAACSWGVGQVLGENADWLGFGTPKALAERAMSGVAGQLEVMLAFVRKRGLTDELNRHDWRGFARVYNGPGQVAVYADRMAAAYRRHAGRAPQPADPTILKIGMQGPEVSLLQQRLRSLGYALHVDGDFGPATKRMVQAFQADQGLTADGIAGPRTQARIDAMLGRPGLG